MKSNPDDREILTLIKFNVIEKIYYYGDHFKSSAPPPKYKFILKSIIEGLSVLLGNITLKKSKLPLGLSSGYTSYTFELNKIGLSEERNVSSIKINNRVTCNFTLFIYTKKIMWSFLYRDFNYLVSNEFIKYVKDYYNKTESFLKANNYSFLIVPNDMSFFLDFI